MSEEPQKILVIADSLDFGDITAYGLSLARGLQRKDHTVVVLTPGGPFVDEFAKSEIRVEEQPFLNSTIIDPFKFKQLINRFIEEKFTIIHALEAGRISLAIKFAKRLKLPVVVSFHDPGKGERLTLDQRWIQEVWTFHEDLRVDLVNQLKVPKELVRVMRSGADIDRAAHHTELYGSDSGTPVIGALGLFTDDQSYTDLLFALHEIVQISRKVHLLIVGDGPAAKRIRHTIDELELETFTTIAASVTNVHTVLPTIDIVCAPIRTPGSMQGILEAMACSRPVVVTAVGGVFEIIKDGETGLVVEPKNPRALRDALVGLIDSEERRAELGNNAREWVSKEFPLDRSIDDVIARYRKFTTQWTPV